MSPLTVREWKSYEIHNARAQAAYRLDRDLRLAPPRDQSGRLRTTKQVR